MSQRDIMECLGKVKDNGNWYNLDEILGMINLTNGGGKPRRYDVYNDLLRLSQFGFIDCKGVGLWDHKKVFRAKHNGKLE